MRRRGNGGEVRGREQWGNASSCHHQGEQPLHQDLHSQGQQRQAVWQGAGRVSGSWWWVSGLWVVSEWDVGHGRIGYTYWVSGMWTVSEWYVDGG